MLKKRTLSLIEHWASTILVYTYSISKEWKQTFSLMRFTFISKSAVSKENFNVIEKVIKNSALLESSVICVF